MKKMFFAVLAICSLMSAVAFAEEARVIDQPGHHPHPGRVVIHDHGHRVIVVHDWRTRFVVRPGIRFRDGVAWDVYRPYWHGWGYWNELAYRWDGRGFYVDGYGYLLAVADYDIIAAYYAAIYPGFNYSWIQIVPWGEEGYDSVVFVQTPNGVEYVMDLNAGF